MNRLAAVVVLAAVLAVPARGGKVTTDPNAKGGEPATNATQAKDPRLDKKITYYSGAKRLHAVADELTQLTGVTIHCGSNSKDWQVRDIPVVVCAKDLPLGTLLKTLAEVAHVSLHRVKLESKEAEPRYRFSRDKKTRDEMDAFFEARRQERLAEDQWAWDVLSRIGSLSDEDLRKLIAVDVNVADAVPMAQLVAGLGPDAKDKFFAGETLTVDGMTSPQAALVKKYWSHYSHKQIGDTPPEINGVPNQPDPIWGLDGLESLRVSFCRRDSGTEETGAAVTVSALKNRHGMSMSTDLASDLHRLERLPELGLPPQPIAHEIERESRITPQNLSTLNEIEDQGPLHTKVKIEKPKDIEKPTFADAMAAISKASGVNIIVEDFSSHRLSWDHVQCRSAYGEKTPQAAISEAANMKWFSSKGCTLIVGWAEYWPRAHTNLMPESVLEDLRAKLRGDGVILDDFAALMLWTQRQRQEWIDPAGDLAPLADAYTCGRDSAIWQLYATLGPEDKAAAQSEAGLSFAKFDPQWLSKFLLDAIRKSDDWAHSAGVEEMGRQVRTLTIRSLVGGLKLTIWPRPDSTETAKRYSVMLSGERDGEKFSIVVYSGARAFPIKAPPKQDAKPRKQ